MCTGVLLCREGGYDREYEPLQALASNPEATEELRSFFLHKFEYEQYRTQTDTWQKKEAVVDKLQILRERKLNHEEKDGVTLILKQVASRMRWNNFDRRVLAGVAAVLNAREFAQHLEAQTRGGKC